MAHDRREFLKTAGITLGATGIAGCLGGGGGDEGQDTTTAAPDTTTEAPETTTEEEADGTTEAEETTEESSDSGSGDLNVGMVYALGGLGDKSFNDMAHRGVQQAEEELGISFQNAQPQQQSDFTTLQRRFATGDFGLVCCIGFAQTDALVDNAANFPEQDWMLVDSVVEEDNVANYTFQEHKGSFLVGQLAGMLTGREFSAGAGETDPDSAKVGFVGGVEVPLIKKFQAGYEAGVAHVDDSIEVSAAYTGSFSDPAAGKEAALSMYQDGADVVYHASGATGLGVFQAAQEEGRFAIGVDADQSESESDYADVIVASMVKRVDTAVFTSIQNKVEGSFQGGSITSLGLEQNGVEAVYGQQLGSDVPQEIKDAVSESRQAIIDGDIEVPSEL